MNKVQHPDAVILHRQARQLIDEFALASVESAGDFAQVEESAQTIIQKLRSVLMTGGLRLSAAHSSAAYQCPCCGDLLRGWASGERRVATAEGEGSYSVTRYRCLRCQEDYYPLEEANGLSGSQFTTGAKAAIADEASERAFGPASLKLMQTRGLFVSAKEVDRTVREVAGWRKEEEEQLTDALFGEGASAARLADPDQDPLSEAPSLHAFADWPSGAPGLISVDGAMLRSPERGPDGLEWFECRAAVIAPACDADSGQKVYLGGVCSPDDLFDLVRAAWCKGGNTGRRCLFVADGARWIWDRVRFYFPEAIQVLDIYHAGEHVASAAAACWGDGSENAKLWRRRAREMLMEPQGPKSILRALTQMLRENEQVVNPGELRKEIRYLFTHRHRMDYARLKTQGLPVASGAMESAIKQLCAQRLRQSGMKWTRKGADAVLRIRAARMSKSLQGTIVRRHDALQERVRSSYNADVPIAA
jgi:hypothetical protein